MKRSTTLCILIVLGVIGSLVTILASSMFISDIGNFGSGLMKTTMLATFPALTVGLSLDALFLYVLRLYKRPKTFKKLTKWYAILWICSSAVGLITSVLSAILIYRSLVRDYPFPGYLIICIILHALAIAGSVFLLLKLKNAPEDEEEFKIKPSYAFSSFGWFLFIALCFNRIGALLGAPVYIQWRTLGLTFPFYLFLLVPILVGAVKVLIDLGYLSNKKTRLALIIAGIAANVILFVVIVILGTQNTLFISAVSPVMGLERLASKPVEIIIHFPALLAVSIIMLVQTLKAKNAE